MLIRTTLTHEEIHAIASGLAPIFVEHDGIMDEVLARREDERELAVAALTEFFFSSNPWLTPNDLVAILDATTRRAQKMKQTPNVSHVAFKKGNKS